jgi:hypothetical protein
LQASLHTPHCTKRTLLLLHSDMHTKTLPWHTSLIWPRLLFHWQEEPEHQSELLCIDRTHQCVTVELFCMQGIRNNNVQ